MASKRKPPPVGPVDAMGGREVQAPPMKPFERGQGTNQGTTTYKSGPFEAPPEAPPGVARGRGMSNDEIERFRKADEKLSYRKGGKVISSRNV